MTPESVVWPLWQIKQKENAPRILIPALIGNKLNMSHISTAASSVHGAPPEKAPHEETAYHIKNISSC